MTKYHRSILLILISNDEEGREFILRSQFTKNQEVDSILNAWIQRFASKLVLVHWYDGFATLQADLRLADLRARRRAMEDLYAALQAVRNVHSALVSTLRIRSVSKAFCQCIKISTWW